MPEPTPPSTPERPLPLVEELLAVGLAEEGSVDGARRDGLRARLALLAWDGLGDRRRAAALLEGVSHPVAASLRLQLAIDEGDREALLALTEDALERRDPAELLTLGDLWLLRAADPDRAAVVYAAAGDVGRRELALALAHAERWADLVALWSEVAEGDEPLAAADLLRFRLARLADGRKLIERQLTGGDPAQTAPELIERAIEYGLRPIEMMRRKLAGLAPSLEQQATRYELGRALEDRAAAEAAQQFAAAAEGDGGFGRLLALRGAVRAHSSTAGWKEAGAAWLALSGLSGDPRWSRLARLRAALLLDLGGDDDERLAPLLTALGAEAPGHPLVIATLGRRLLAQGDRAGLAALLLAACEGEPTSDGRRQRVAQLLEIAEDPRAEGRWRDLAPETPAALAAQVRRARRRGDRGALAALYRKLAADGGTAAGPLLLTAGVLDLLRGRRDEAGEAIAAAVAIDGKDLLGRVALALCHREARRPREYASSLREALEAAASPSARGELWRETARLQAGELGDRRAAEESYEKALELDPDNPDTLEALAALCGESGRWPRAIELLERATGPGGAALLCRVGNILADRVGDEGGARAAYERALAAEPRSRDALAALAVMHRRAGRPAELLSVLERRLELAEDPAERLPLLVEIGRVAGEPGGPIDRSLLAYRAALAIDASHPAALDGLEQTCRREGRWEALVDSLERSPATGGSPQALAALAEGLGRLARWPRLAEVGELRLALLRRASPAAAVEVARDLARLYEDRLGDLDGAARAWHTVDEALPGELEAPRALERIYESRGRLADVAAAIERELWHLAQRPIAPADNARQIELWLRLGEIRRTTLGHAEQAADAFESALRLDPRRAEALAALGGLYVELGRPHDLERVLQARALATDDPRQRAALLLQKGELLERTSDDDGALATYREAFALDPSNRALFTALERVAYRRERWEEAMALYDGAVTLVEAGKLRAYRLSDLHLRRAQVFHQYMGQPAKAAAAYVKVMELDPEPDAAPAALERLYSAQEDWAGLIRVLEHRASLVREDSKRVEILRRAAQVAAAQLRDPQAVARLYAVLHATDPTDPEALDALERHYDRVHDWEKLVDVLRTRIVLTTSGDEAIALYLRIGALSEEGLRDLDRAIEAYRKILDIVPSHREALDALARLCEATEKWAELVDVTRRQIRIVTDRQQKALLYFKCGSVMEAKYGKDDDAIRYYDAAIKTSPACLPAVHGLRDLHLRREDWARVIDTLLLEAKLWTDDKERAGVYARIGQICNDKLRDHQRATEYYESALDSDPDCLPASRALFDVYFSRHDYARALPLSTVLVQKVMREGDPATRSDFYRRRAIVCREMGDRQAAAEALVAALELRPENIEALDLMVELCRAAPSAADFPTIFRELEKVYRRRDTPRAVARVLVAQGILRCREYDVEAAEKLLGEAIGLAPDDLPVVEALVDLHVQLRRFDAAAGVLDAFVERCASPATRAQARLRLAEIYSEGAMSPQRTMMTLELLIAQEPTNREAHFRLAQEHYLLGRYPEALKLCERLINLAASPAAAAPPEELSRYYDYLGRVAETTGDFATAQRSFRRAIDLNPAFPAPVLSLARRCMLSSDAAQAQALIEQAERSAAARGPDALRELRRGLARHYTALGDRRRAGELYVELLAQDPDDSDDRIGLAALLAREPASLDQARQELLRVLAKDIRAAAAFRLLLLVHERKGQTLRAGRVASVVAMLGYTDEGDRIAPVAPQPPRTPLSEEANRLWLLPPAAFSAYGEALRAVRESIEARYPVPRFGPVQPLASPTLKQAAADVRRLLGADVEVVMAEGVPGGALPFESPRPVVVVDAALDGLGEGEARFLLGRAMAPVAGGWSLPLRVGLSGRAELGRLLRQILVPAERELEIDELAANLPRKAQRVVEKLVADQAGLAAGPVGDWFQAIAEGADRAGLLACDDVAAAVRVLALLGGEEVARDQVVLGQVPGGADLVRFYLSDAYDQLCFSLGQR